MEMSPQAEMPSGRPQRTKPAEYRYSFPTTTRALGGGFGVDEASRRLICAFNLHTMNVKAIAGWLISVPEYEIKIELAHHLYMHAEAARNLRERLYELRVPRAKTEVITTPVAELLVREVKLAKSTRDFVEGQLILIETVSSFYRDYEQETDQLLDLPSLRVLQIIRNDLEGMSSWCRGVSAEFKRVDGPSDEIESWCNLLRSLVEAAGGLAGEITREAQQAETLRINSEGDFRRQFACKRDERFSTFHHTRQYSDDAMGPNGEALSDYLSKRLEVIRTQRDEMDAVETFANVLFDLERPPFELMLALARFIWDEARHSEMGQKTLQALGYDPFAIPCGIIGINVRSPLPPLLAFAQINTFGELNQVGGLKALSNRAHEQGDTATGRSVDFVHADEMLHLREGRKWLRKLLEQSGTSLEEFEEEARLQAIQRLRDLGVFNEDYGLDTTARQLAEMLGE